MMYLKVPSFPRQGRCRHGWSLENLLLLKPLQKRNLERKWRTRPPMTCRRQDSSMTLRLRPLMKQNHTALTTPGNFQSQNFSMV